MKTSQWFNVKVYGQFQFRVFAQSQYHVIADLLEKGYESEDITMVW